jgi:hypothetical protein
MTTRGVKTVRHLIVLTAVLVAVTASSASATWFEDFDSYTNGSGMIGQGGWVGWDDNPYANAYVTQAVSYSSPQSVDITGATDLVHPFDGYTSGVWEFSAMQYIQCGLSTNSYLILLDQYNSGGPYHWTAQLNFDPVNNVVVDDMTGAQLPLIYEQWVQILVKIDLDNDWKEIYYNGQFLSEESWTRGDGYLNIGALDLYANNATSVYYDDISLIPEPSLLSIAGLGLLLLLRRRR